MLITGHKIYKLQNKSANKASVNLVLGLRAHAVISVLSNLALQSCLPRLVPHLSGHGGVGKVPEKHSSDCSVVGPTRPSIYQLSHSSTLGVGKIGILGVKTDSVPAIRGIPIAR